MRVLIYLLVVIFGFNSCSHQQEIIAEKDFFTHLDSYIKYIDSTNSYKENFDFIYLKASTRNDSAIFEIYLNGGSYDFFHEKSIIKDFIKYKNYHILFIGDYPNEIVKIRQNNYLNIKKDIIRKYYSSDYLKYQQDTLSVGPLIYDYMTIYLIYKRDKLISVKRQYY